MSKLTDTQLLILSKASQRTDHAVVLPEILNRVAAGKIVAGLMKRQLLAETQAGPDMPVWRTDNAGIRFALVITKAGLQALGVTDDTDPSDEAPATNGVSDAQADPVRTTDDANGPAPSEDGPCRPKPPRPDSKLGAVLALLQRPDGATLDDLIQATGWLSHTTRAALTGLRQRDYIIETAREQGRPTVYRVVTAADPTASDDVAMGQG
jgi:hypothetical protein